METKQEMMAFASNAIEDLPAAQAAFDKALAVWLEKAQAIVNANYVGHPFPPPTLTCEPGRRYVKIVRVESYAPGGSVHCFIDTTNGDVLKAESWKKPAKGARGNIFQAGREGVTCYGAHYAR